MALRVAINKFATANKGYRGAKVYVFTVDDDFEKTNTKAILYDGPTGTGQLANPVTLDSAGKFDTIPYVEVSVICTVNSMDFGEHDTGITRVPGGWEGGWGPNTVYQADDLVKDGSAGNDTGNVYICLQPHTSGTVFQTDVDAGYWALIFDIGGAAASATSAEDWAVKTGAPVEGSEYSAKENAVGTTPGIGGSAKAWATTAHNTTVPGGGGEYSAKHYATETAADAIATAADAISTAADAVTASSGASTATTQAGIATTQAGLAATAKTAAEAAQAAAEAAETNAAASEAAAGTSETNAATSASTATTQAGIATGAAADALDSETAAGASAIAAAASAADAASSFDSLDDRYLGAKAADPTLDNDGNALVTGAIYFNTSSNIMKVWNGSSWDVTVALASPLGVAAGGTGATDAAGARTNLGLDSVVALVGSSASPMLRLTQTGAGPVLLAEDSANPDTTPFTVLADGKVVIGDTAVRSFYGTTSFQGGLLYLASDDTSNGGGLMALNYDASTAAPAVVLAKSRGDALNTRGIVGSTDPIGYLYFAADDGAAALLIRAAYVAAVVDGTPGSSDMPARLVFATTPDGQATPTEKLRIDNAGRIVAGATSAKTFGGSVIPIFQALGADAGAAGLGAAAYAASAVGPAISLAKSRHATVGSHTIVQANDTLGAINFAGSDGTDFDMAAQITAEVGGTPGAGTDMPGRLRFKVSPDGSATPADALVINPDKTLQMPAYGVGVLTADSSGNITSVAAGTGTEFITGNDTIDNADKGKTFIVTADCTIAFADAATLDSDWRVSISLSSVYGTLRVVVLDPNSTQEIDLQTQVRAYGNEHFNVWKHDATNLRTDRASDICFGTFVFSGSATTVSVNTASQWLDDPEINAGRIIPSDFRHDNGSSRSYQLCFADSGNTVLTSAGDYNVGNLTSFATPAGNENSTDTNFTISASIGSGVDSEEVMIDWCTLDSTTYVHIVRLANGAVVDPKFVTVDAAVGGFRINLSSTGNITAGKVEMWGRRGRKA